MGGRGVPAVGGAAGAVVAAGGAYGQTLLLQGGEGLSGCGAAYACGEGELGDGGVFGEADQLGVDRCGCAGEPGVSGSGTACRGRVPSVVVLDMREPRFREVAGG
ncbi:hypothetical protein DDW44_23475 [Streptomyces tirandamycinicus]|uniref:Uncharacterized protein n=1 Tax=Streptomyces tirandamycinicus TaxID=2174846 RepID=A0A2S1SYA5_9ACTN|nr:hypothetical protein DDW44_23475 [Streptomyces tirandamycinicus]